MPLNETFQLNIVWFMSAGPSRSFNKISCTKLGFDDLLPAVFFILVRGLLSLCKDLDVGQGLESRVVDQVLGQLLGLRGKRFLDVLHGLFNSGNRVNGGIGEVVTGQLGESLQEL